MLDALRSHGLLERALAELDRPREPAGRAGRRARCAARAQRPEASARIPTTSTRTKYAALALAVVARRAIPRLLAHRIRRGEMDAVMVHWRLMSPGLLRAVHDAGGEVYVWTVDDAAMVRDLVDLGVDGVITNDPRLFRP